MAAQRRLVQQGKTTCCLDSSSIHKNASVRENACQRVESKTTSRKDMCEHGLSVSCILKTDEFKWILFRRQVLPDRIFQRSIQILSNAHTLLPSCAISVWMLRAIRCVRYMPHLRLRKELNSSIRIAASVVRIAFKRVRMAFDSSIRTQAMRTNARGAIIVSNAMNNQPVWKPVR